MDPAVGPLDSASGRAGEPSAIRRFAGWALVAGLSLASATAIVALLAGSFGDIELRVTLSSIGFALHELDRGGRRRCAAAASRGGSARSAAPRWPLLLRPSCCSSRALDEHRRLGQRGDLAGVRHVRRARPCGFPHLPGARRPPHGGQPGGAQRSSLPRWRSGRSTRFGVVLAINGVADEIDFGWASLLGVGPRAAGADHRAPAHPAPPPARVASRARPPRGARADGRRGRSPSPTGSTSSTAIPAYGRPRSGGAGAASRRRQVVRGDSGTPDPLRQSSRSPWWRE